MTMTVYELAKLVRRMRSADAMYRRNPGNSANLRSLVKLQNQVDNALMLIPELPQDAEPVSYSLPFPENQ